MHIAVWPKEKLWSKIFIKLASSHTMSRNKFMFLSIYHSISDSMALLNAVLSLLWLFSCKVVFNSLQPHGLQHTRLLCPPLSPRVSSDSCLLSRWCHPSHPLLLHSPLSSVFPSIGIFRSESALPIRWPKYWSFIFSISASNEFYAYCVLSCVNCVQLFATPWTIAH